MDRYEFIIIIKKKRDKIAWKIDIDTNITRLLLVPSPFASHAFHPLDGYSPSIPYHLFVYLIPMQKWQYIGMFIFVNIWTVMIHDGK